MQRKKLFPVSRAVILLNFQIDIFSQLETFFSSFLFDVCLVLVFAISKVDFFILFP